MPFDFDANPLSLSGLFPATTAPVQIDVYGYCQMSCFYCFSNLNKSASGRTLNLKSSAPTLFRALDRALADETDPLGYFLREGYFAALSNTSDGFQREEKTHRASEAVLAWAKANRVPLFIETKGNVLLEEWDRYAPLIVPERTCVYLSLSMLDDVIRRRMEPGALPVSGRLELMRRLADLGCGVIAACNPYVPAWVPDLDEYCEAVRDAGAQSVLPFYLHFTPEQEAEIPAFYAAEVRKANVLPQFQIQGFKRWMAAAAQARIHCVLHPLWDAASGYASGGMAASPALAGRGRQAFWLHEFMQTVAAHSKASGGVPVLFSWQDVERRLRTTGVVDVPLKSTAFDNSWMNSTEGHRAFRSSVPKTVNLYALLRWGFNTPWFVPRGIWADPHTRSLFDTEGDYYVGDQHPDGTKDMTGVYLPVAAARQALEIDRSEFDCARAAWLPGREEREPCLQN